MKKPLLSDLQDAQRVALASLVQHPGWRIVEDMHFEAVQAAKEELIRIDPGNPDAPRLLAACHTKARAVNDFSASVFKSIEYHINAIGITEEENKKPHNPIIPQYFKAEGQ